MPTEMIENIILRMGGRSIFAYILLVRTATVCIAWHAAIAAMRHRVVTHFNARLLLPPAYLFGEYGSSGRTWSVGCKGDDEVVHPINENQKLTFEVHKGDGPLCIIVVLKVSIVLAPVTCPNTRCIDTTLELNLALNFFDPVRSFSLCAALGWPNGTLQAEQAKLEAKEGRVWQALRKKAFDRHDDNQPAKLSINWDHPLSEMSVRVTGELSKVDYTATLKKNKAFEVNMMRAVHDYTDKWNFTGRAFDPKPHLWLELTGFGHPKMFSGFTMCEKRLDDTKIITRSMSLDGWWGIMKFLYQHFDLCVVRYLHDQITFRAFEPLAFETAGELNNKASGLHLMHTFGYLEIKAHRAEVARRHILEMAKATNLTPSGRGSKRAAAAAAEQAAALQMKRERKGERQDECPNGGDLLPARK